MPASRKIFLGGISLIAGVAMILLAEFTVYRAASQLQKDGIQVKSYENVGEAGDRALETIHLATKRAFYGIIAGYVIIAVGVLFLVLGIYRTAKDTELLKEKLLHGKKPSSQPEP